VLGSDGKRDDYGSAPMSPIGPFRRSRRGSIMSEIEG
jgi:hypothetical protein